MSEVVSFNKTVVEVPCPSCKFPNAVTLREVRFGLTIPCRGCKGNIRLIPMDGGLGKAERAIENLLDKFTKKLQIKV
jgi:hypothetical protein